MSIDLEKIYDSRSCGKFRVLEYRSYHDILIEFIDTGYNCVVSKYHMDNGQVKDKLFKSICGVACFGDGSFKLKDPNTGKNAVSYTNWYNMIDRCYNPNAAGYKVYSDCVVCDEWLNYQNFAKWFIETIPDDYSSDKYHLDKDLKVPGNRIYSPELCQFIPAEENRIDGRSRSPRIKNRNKTTIRDPQGNIHVFTDLTNFAKKFEMNASTLREARLKLKKNFLGGWCVISNEEFDPMTDTDKS